jgi:hypothetical protein
VPASHAEKLQQANTQAQSYIIEGAGHTFGGKHPHTGNELPHHTALWVKHANFFLDKYFNPIYSSK